jgi:GNAT superfamily N-acetyltransferase
MAAARDSGEAVTLVRVAEAELGPDIRPQLQALLQRCFPGYPRRTYFKLPPHFRYLAMAQGALVGQMGVEFRVIRAGGDILRTLGVVDLCVLPGERSRGLAARLLTEVTELAHSSGMDFVILFADDDRVYARNGWTRQGNRCTWVKIHEHTTLGLARAAQTGALMVKATGPRAWPTGEVDLLGHLF